MTAGSRIKGCEDGRRARIPCRSLIGHIVAVPSPGGGFLAFRGPSRLSDMRQEVAATSLSKSNRHLGGVVVNATLIWGSSMQTEYLTDDAFALLGKIQAVKLARHFDPPAAWELIERGLADVRQDPFRIVITSAGEAHPAVSSHS
ncbi:hypothetical protein [Aurantimonas sp. A3-2-R12]|uniref:hypothetical protein n=1 Tax=Aurantimonas sp. A3-2-R12 TaxID=3114362 RepID=UPI002E193442|nr:hypothetical protein [Aurantimonas sp. A3-2-R12]